MSCCQLSVKLFDFRGDFIRRFLEHAEITNALQLEPKLWALSEKFSQAKGHFRRDGAASHYNLIDRARADTNGSRQSILRNAHRLEVVFE